MILSRCPLGILSVLVFSAAGACMGPPDPIAADDAGSLAASLQLSPTASLNTASYVIAGPNAFSRAGTIDTSHSQTVAATIGGHCRWKKCESSIFNECWRCAKGIG